MNGISAIFKHVCGTLQSEAFAVYFREYYKIILLTYHLMVMGTIFGMFIRVDGKPQICMLISIISCILNVILDYIFVGKLGMGVQGSAIGSLIVQLVVATVQFSYFLKATSGIRLCRFRFDRAINKEIIFNGSSEFIGEMASAISRNHIAFGFHTNSASHPWNDRSLACNTMHGSTNSNCVSGTYHKAVKAN